MAPIEKSKSRLRPLRARLGHSYEEEKKELSESKH